MAGVIWSLEARQDLDAIFIRLSSESRAYSHKWIDEVFRKIELIENFPNLGRKVPEIKIGNIREIRLVGIGFYIILERQIPSKCSRLDIRQSHYQNFNL